MPTERPVRDYVTRAYTIGVSGSVGSGKTTLLLALCRLLRDNYSIAVVTRKPAAAGQDGSRDFLIRHKALARSRIVAVEDGSHADLAIEWLMTEARPELIFVENDGRDSSDTLTDFTIHVVNGSGGRISPDDALGAAQSDLLVVNKTSLGASLDPERDIAVREAVQSRGEAACVFSHLRYGIGTIEIARQLLGSWRQTGAPAAWTVPLDGHVVLTPA